MRGGPGADSGTGSSPLVVTAGYASLDRIARVSKFPAPGTTAVVDSGDDELYWGGCAFNVAVGLARLGTRAGVIGVLGDDQNGRRYQDWLAKSGVDTRGISVRRGPTARSALYYDRDGTSVCYYWPGPAPEAEGSQEPLEILGSAAWLVLTVAPAELTNRLLDESARRDLPVIWSVKADPTVYPAALVRRLLAQAKILFMNQHEREFLRRFVPDEELFTTGPEIIVLTMGKKGGVVHRKGKSFHYTAARAAEARDGTGVGDAFIAGFLWAHLEGRPLRDACRAGALNAAAVLEKVGSQTGLCTREELAWRQKQGAAEA